jgi:hypothetical protein
MFIQVRNKVVHQRLYICNIHFHIWWLNTSTTNPLNQGSYPNVEPNIIILYIYWNSRVEDLLRGNTRVGTYIALLTWREIELDPSQLNWESRATKDFTDVPLTCTPTCASAAWHELKLCTYQHQISLFRNTKTK